MPLLYDCLSNYVHFLITAQASTQPDIQQSPMGGMPQQGAPGQPPFMQPNSFPGMPGGFSPNMVPPGMGGFPGPMPGQGQQPVPQQMPVQGGPDNSVVAHKLPSSQVSH